MEKLGRGRLLFHDGTTDMNKGTLVKIKDGWEPDGLTYIITEWNGDRGFISPLFWEGIRPTELVHKTMIEPLTETTAAL